ncbi:NUDIX hydrolase [Thalassobacterium maritimum]|uniref:NUDIX hydrolase n=1 Tax=Thalassobacterium maritimum TaxID=3041265 RepID=UPI002810FA4D|nr:NUDIX hydrolase [Coraliomargarita sp. SDUM461003]
MRAIKHTILSDTKWLKLVEAEAEIQGRTKQWVYCSRRRDVEQPIKTPDAVVIVPFVKHPEGTQLLLVREYRMPINQTMIALPAGLVDPGERCESTAERELLEETGYAVTAVLDKSPPTLFPSAGLTDECFQFVFVEAEYRGPAAPEASEEIEVVPVTIEGLRALMAGTSAFCGRTWPLCYQYLQMSKFPI